MRNADFPLADIENWFQGVVFDAIRLASDPEYANDEEGRSEILSQVVGEWTEEHGEQTDSMGDVIREDLRLSRAEELAHHIKELIEAEKQDLAYWEGKERDRRRMGPDLV